MRFSPNPPTIPVERKISITDQVWARLTDAVKKLEETLQRRNPQAKISRISVYECSLTRGVMVRGSDIDEMYIGVDGVAAETIPDLTRRFSEWLACDGLELSGNNNIPQIVSTPFLVRREAELRAVGKNILPVFENGQFTSRRNLMKRSVTPQFQSDKYVARVLLLALMGELHTADTSILLGNLGAEKRFGHCFVARLLAKLSEKPEPVLSPAARRVVFLLNEAANTPGHYIEILQEEAISVQQALCELMDWKLVVVYENRLVPVWMFHSPRFSDRFWEDQIILAVLGRDGERKNLVEVAGLSHSGDAWLRELAGWDVNAHREDPALWWAGAWAALAVSSDFVAAAIMDAVNARGVAIDYPLSSLTALLEHADDIHQLNSPSTRRAHYILRLIPEFVRRQTASADKAARFLLEKFLISGNPEFLVMPSLTAVGFLWPHIFDSRLRENLKEAVHHLEESPVEWVAELSRKVFRAMALLESVETETVEEAAQALGTEAPILSYNKGIARVTRDGDTVQVQTDFGSVPMAMRSILHRMGGGVVLCSALTSEESLLAWTGRLLCVGERIWIKFIPHPEAEFASSYRHFCNPFLWLLQHSMLHEMCDGTSAEMGWDFSLEHSFDNFQRVSHRLSRGLVSLAKTLGSPRLFLQDYHLMLVAGHLRALGETWPINLFMHIPWPDADYLTGHVSAAMARKMLEGLLGNSVLQFQTPEDVARFMDACELILGVTTDKNTGVVPWAGRRVRVEDNPISISANEIHEKILEGKAISRAMDLRAHYRGKQLIVRFERTDLTKGILEGLLAFQDLLRRHPEWLGKASMYCALQPHRQDLAPYQRMAAWMESITVDINREFAPTLSWNGIFRTAEERIAHETEEWPPLILDLTPGKEWTPFLLSADVALVNPLIDGMNLVAKGFAVVKDPVFLDEVHKQMRGLFGEQAERFPPAIIVGSKNMGAWREIDDGALGVDPHDVKGTAESLDAALGMSMEERHRRAAATAQQVRRNDVENWIERLAQSLSQPLLSTPSS